MDSDFEKVERRFRALRMTKAEFLQRAGIGKVRYWRAAEGQVGDDTRVRVLREAEACLDRLESPVICSVCDRRADDPAVRGCTDFGCPITKQLEAA